MILRFLTVAGLALAFAVAASAAQASVIIDSANPRDDTGVTQAGLTYKETGATIDNFGAIAWYVDRLASEARILGYSQDINDLVLKNTIDGSPSDPAGELGRDIAGIGFLPNQQLLAIADNTNDRVVIYDRINVGSTDPPVDYSAGRSLSTDASGTLLGAPRGLAVNEETGVVYVSVDTGLNGRGIVAFDAVTGNEIHQATGYATGDPGVLAVDRVTSTVFAAIDGTGTIQALQPGLTDGVAGYLHPIMTSGTPGDYISLSADPQNNRLWALKANQLDIFNMATGTLLGTTSGYDFAGEATSISASTPYYGISYSSQVAPRFHSFFATSLPVCNPQAPPTVAAGASITFTPDCNDDDLSPVREYAVTNSQTRGSAVVSSDHTTFTYTASASASSGQDDIAYRAVTQNGMSVVKHQLVNVAAAPAAPPAEQPVVRKTTNLQLDSGNVFIKVPGSNEFVKLTKDTLIPVGTVIDARDGKAHLTFANADGTTYDGIFWDGVFQIVQGSGDKPLATLKLRDDLVEAATASSVVKTSAFGKEFTAQVARKRGKKKNGLWGDAKGKYRTSGKGGTATVRGTRWYVANYTYGSLFKVQRGVVEIDPIRGKNFNLKAGKQFFIFYKR